MVLERSPVASTQKLNLNVKFSVISREARKLGINVAFAPSSQHSTQEWCSNVDDISPHRRLQARAHPGIIWPESCVLISRGPDAKTRDHQHWSTYGVQCVVTKHAIAHQMRGSQVLPWYPHTSVGAYVSLLILSVLFADCAYRPLPPPESKSVFESHMTQR